MEDLSDLATNSMWPTSQAAGNMMSSNKDARTAPGSQPVYPVPDKMGQTDPTVEVGKKIPVGGDGKKQARDENWSPPGAPSWTTPPAHSN